MWRDLFPFLLFFELEGPKVSVFVWLCRDFLAEFHARNIEVALYRDTERIDSRRRFYDFFFLFVGEKSFSRQTLVSARMTENICRIVYRNKRWSQTYDHIRWSHIRILPVDTCMYVYVCLVCGCVCIAFSVSIVFGILQEWKKKGEETIYRYLKKVYFTIPLAVEDR